MLCFEIRTKGRIDEHWSSWFEGLAIDHIAEEETVLIGKVPDQAALYGVPARLRDLGLALISPKSDDAGPTELPLPASANGA